VDAEQLLVVHGSQQGIDLCARLLLDEGDAFVFENPGYLMARLCFEATGARALATPVDAFGLDTSALPDDPRCRLAYVTPSHQFPLGGVLPHRRRQQLLQWAKPRGAWIVEDDYDGEFRYGQHPVDAMQVTDTDGRVIYIGTFSKVLSPELRLGYLVLPHSLVPVFRKAKRMSDRHAPVLDQRVLAALIDNGVYERHVRRMRREHEKRRAALLDTIARELPTAQVAGAAAGLHIVLWLPTLGSDQEAALVAAARREGIGIYGVSSLYAIAADATPPRPAGLVIGYGSLSVEAIEQGFAKLSGITRRFEQG
jgi:GntR family transcriptional regulator/MocR family aminotransferase